MEKENWRDKFGSAWENAHSPQWRHPADGIRHFISTEIIEKLIADIPDTANLEVSDDYQKEIAPCDLMGMKQQLRDKWL